MKDLKLGLIFLFVFCIPSASAEIQDLINNASEGEIIYIQNGTYNEVLIINKSLTLIGNGTVTIIGTNFTDLTSYGYPPWCLVTIIPSDVDKYNISLKGDVISIFADNVTLENLNIEHSRGYNRDSLIYAKNIKFLKLKNINMNDTCYGVHLNNVTSSIIENVSVPTRLHGIVLRYSQKNIIRNSFGRVFLDYSEYNKITNNSLTNLKKGHNYYTNRNLEIINSPNNYFKSNYVINDVYLRDSDNSTFERNDINSLLILKSKNYKFINETFKSKIIVDSKDVVDVNRYDLISTASLNSLSGYYDITGTITNNTAIIRFYFNEADLIKLGIQAKDLKIKYYRNEWIDVIFTLNLSESYLEVEADHFSYWTIAYDLPQTPPSSSSGGGSSSSSGGGGLVVTSEPLTIEEPDTLTIPKVVPEDEVIAEMTEVVQEPQTKQPINWRFIFLIISISLILIIYLARR